jgi:molecular chaperone GrpE (heat shock protein)
MRYLALSSLIFILLPGMAASEVYRWVDEHGDVHFGDRAPRERDAEQVTIEAPPPENDPEVHRRLEEIDRLNAINQEDRERAKEKAAKEEAERQRLEQQCAIARKRLERSRTASYLYLPNDDGTRRILSDMDRSKAIREMEAEIAEHCR